MSEGESVAMWKLYSIKNFDVAVRSTIQGLAESLPPFQGQDVENQRDLPNPEVLPLETRLVRYIDFSADEKVLPKPWELHLYKRASFEFEKELRLVARASPYQGGPTNYSVFPNNGDWVPVQLNSLIEEGYVAPAAPSWYFDLIAMALKRHHMKTKSFTQISTGKRLFKGLESRACPDQVRIASVDKHLGQAHVQAEHR